MKAIIFGSIGTLVETSDIQRQSFNHAFMEIGLDWYWDKNNYKNSDYIMKNGLLIGCHQGLSIKQIKYIHTTINRFIKK